MKTGLFCNYENHHQDARRAIFEQVLLVKQAENLGFEDDVIRYAADKFFGLMGGPPFSLFRLINTVNKYREINNIGADKFLLARFFFVAKNHDEAVSEALPFIRKFSQKMIANSTQVMQNSPHPQKSYDQINICYEIDYLIENSIIGDVQICRDKIKKFQDELNLSTIALKPSSLSLQKNLESLQRYNQEVRNYV